MNFNKINMLSVLLCFCLCSLSAQKDYNKALDKMYVSYKKAMKKGFNDIDRIGIETEEHFSIDGLLHRPAGEKGGKESFKWNSSKLRILLLLKDVNGNDGYSNSRNYERVNNNFGRNIAAWIYGLFKIYENNSIPSAMVVFGDNKKLEDAFTTKPFAIVNIKKKVGKQSVTDIEVEKYANKYKDYIQREIDILNPNVILCCGGWNGAILNYAKDIILKEPHYAKKKYHFKLVEDTPHGLIFYDSTYKLMLIRTYHPSARVSQDKIYTRVMEDFFKCYNKLLK